MLFFAQLVLSAVIVLTAEWSRSNLLAIALSVPGALIAISAWWAMGLSKVRVHPSPTEQTVLVTRGPYRWIRHPMYSGLLLFTAALLIQPFALWRIALWFLLLIVLVVKLQIEERLLNEHLDQYAAYQRRTSRLLPLIW